MTPRPQYVLDYETRSEANLKLVGAYEYARHPSTEILCVAYGRVDSVERPEAFAPARSKFKGIGDNLAILQILQDPDFDLIASNAFFERMITQFVFGRQYPELLNIPISRWHCVAAMASTHALPRDLARQGKILRLPITKNEDGKKLLRAHSIPQRLTKNNPNIWNDDPAGLTKLTDYCIDDVETSRGVWHALPKLIPRERKIWKLNQKINTRGLYVDRPLVQTVSKMVKTEVASLTGRFRELAGGEIQTAGQRAKVLEWCKRNGVGLPNLQAKTVLDQLKKPTPDAVRELLEIRQSISKTSTAKLGALEVRTRSDSRLHDYLMYHGASTGRDSGAGVQPHNFPRGAIKNMDEACRVLMTGDLEWVRALLGVPMTAFSGALRGMIKASPGHELFCADFNAIEARVLFWLARHTEGLDMFTGGRDPYREMASKIYRVKLKDVTPEQREVGKRAILGCGFGMGWKKFMQTCELFGTPVSVKLAKLAVKTYREEHAPVVRLWYNLERAAILAVQTRKTYTVNRTKWFVKGRFLYCKLPCGRSIAYCDPSIRFEKTPWGEMRPKLYHWGVDPKTKQWVNSATYGGKLTENVVQGTARDKMKDGELRVEGKGYRMLLSVHDEILAERKKGQGNLKEFETLMASHEKWSENCPVIAKGWQGDRYHK